MNFTSSNSTSTIVFVSMLHILLIQMDWAVVGLYSHFSSYENNYYLIESSLIDYIEEEVQMSELENIFQPPKPFLELQQSRNHPYSVSKNPVWIYKMDIQILWMVSYQYLYPFTILVDHFFGTSENSKMVDFFT